MMNKNIAVVGCGYWGRNLVRNFAELGALHTICDKSHSVLSQYIDRYQGVKRETDFESVLSDKDIKGIAISSPAALHYAMSREALLAGKDVFVEKPLALLVNEGEELVGLAKEKGRILMVGHLLLYHPAIIELKRIIDKGELGKINYIYSSRLNLGKFRTEENILWSFAPHDISVIIYLLNESPLSVSAHGGCYLTRDIADVTLTTMNFKSGVNAHIFVSWLHPYKEQKLVVVGDRKMAMFDDTRDSDKLLLYEHKIEWIDRLPVSTKESPVAIKIDDAEPLRLECQHFLDCMESREKAKTSGEEGLEVLKILDGCQRSLSGQGENVVLNEGEKYYVDPSSIVEQPCIIGDGTKIWHYTHIMPNTKIGESCTIGQNVFIGRNVAIGNNVKIQNNVSVFEGVVLEDDVFCGPSCVFTNVKKPRGHISQKGKYVATLVKKGATIGANATIICGNTIGQYVFIGAGSVVTNDVPDHALIYGNPARIEGWVCKCGTKLDFNAGTKAKCDVCNMEYVKVEGEKGVRIQGVEG